MSEQQDYNRRLIEEFRGSRGSGDQKFAGRPLLLLTTTGAKSGRRHAVPIMYVPDGDRLLVIASNAGAPTHPQWYRNLLAHPDVTVEIGSETYEATTMLLEGAERQRKWSEIVAAYPFFGEYQAKITREIPVVAVVRRVS